jgi:hypothetical protein
VACLRGCIVMKGRYWLHSFVAVVHWTVWYEPRLLLWYNTCHLLAACTGCIVPACCSKPHWPSGSSLLMELAQRGQLTCQNVYDR